MGGNSTPRTRWKNKHTTHFSRLWEVGREPVATQQLPEKADYIRAEARMRRLG